MGNARNDARLVSDFAAWAVQQPEHLDPDVIEMLVEYKASFLDDPHPGRWIEGDLSELLLSVFPRKVSADDQWIPVMVPTVRAYMRFVDQTGRLTRDSASVSTLQSELDKIDEGFAEAMHDTSRFGMAKTLFLAMSRDGVDVSDQDAITRWTEQLNSRSYDERAALTDPYLDANPYDEDDGGGGTAPPIVLPPIAQLAAAARTCELLSQAVALAHWVGRRKVTATGQLRLADARAAVVELGLMTADELARRELVIAIRSARELAPLAYLWEVAVALGLLELGRTTAGPGAAWDGWRGSDEDLLEVWADAFAVVGDIGPMGAFPVADEHAVREVARALTEMYFGAAITTTEIVENATTTVLMQLPSVPVHYVRPSVEASILGFVDRLVSLGAVVAHDEELGLTALGRWGLHRSLEGSGTTAPIVHADPNMAASDIIKVLGALAPTDGQQLWTAWTAQRSVAEAAAELLAAASAATPMARFAAASIITDELPESEAAAAFTAVVDDPVLRPHAVSWLAAHGRPVDLTARDSASALVELIAAAIESDDGAGLHAILTKPGFDVQLMESLWRCGHPATADVLAAVGSSHPDKTVAKAARKAAFKAQSRSG
jgi:hypothetical protein